ncbi:MAG: glycosyltransferase family 4 protein [Thermodesulfobacteriota bacterium]|nr:glycosyltransferase family 4 protein [Thermodesulfobacteriota bacterium]
MSSAQDLKVVIFSKRKVHTGGERYLAEVHAYLQSQGVSVIPVWIDNLPRWPRSFGLILDCLVSNIWLFWQVRHLGGFSNILFFEDFHLHPRLCLCNELLRLKNRNLQVVVLMQSSLFYHTAVRKPIARKLDQWVVRTFFNKAGLVICNSEFSQSQVVSFGVDPVKTRVVFCGYEGANNPQYIHRHTNPDNRHHLLFVGQCVVIKGLECLVSALSLLGKQDVVLDIVGNTEAEPEYFAKLERLVAKLGMLDQVKFHGCIDHEVQLSYFYKQADIFILPSLSEGFGIVLLEAMSFGLPIIATRAGAIPELVRDGENGLLVPSQNPQALADAIESLLQSPNLRAEYGRNGYNFAQDKREFYSWDTVGERILTSIRELSL